ncbi:AAA family ATPase [Nocardia sp. NPDC056100]|uniref:AAA family ATPase n=1 Tax=Nocardia sp. NPDC056100 TaxID=3345712 RepID=UPI0035D920CE
MIVHVEVLSAKVKAVLRDCAKELDGHGVLAVCGFPGSGKSTAAWFVAAAAGASVLDKDSFAPNLEKAVMAQLTGDPYDRDSDSYKTVVAPHIYEGLVRTGFTVAMKHPVVLDAPFLAAITQAANAGMSLSEYLRTLASASAPLPVTTIWVDSSAAEIHSRMTARGEERDAPKLADWEVYQTAVLDSGLREIAHSVVDLVIEN